MSNSNSVTLTLAPPSVASGGIVLMRAEVANNASSFTYLWEFTGGLLRGFQPIPGAGSETDARWDTSGLRPSSYTVRVTASRADGAEPPLDAENEIVITPGFNTVAATLQRTGGEATTDIGLWMAIRRSARNLSFDSYNAAIERLLVELETSGRRTPAPTRLANFAVRRTLPFPDTDARRALPFNDTDAYRFLKVATEAFLIANTGDVLSDQNYFTQADIDEAGRRLNGRGANIDLDQLRDYLVATPIDDAGGETVATLPYLAIVRRKLREVGLRRVPFGERGAANDLAQEFDGILETKLTAPLLLELIWSYWHEEGMLVQSINAISRRFQNIRGPVERDPLAGFETDPLRPLNNLLWGYIQDEQHRLTVVRRVYEYDHHYGITLYGKSVPQIRSADSRPKFLEAFHTLLYLCTQFFPQDDDTTVIADGFPVLNALKEVHLLLTQGAHNQHGDLPATARQEMLLQQWLLARPEFREFLPTRIMVAYPEPWMDRVDAMKQLQGWTNTSVLHFHNLAIYGEQILLGARYGAWSTVNEPSQAANWARFWRPEIQGYIHAYRAVTGVDLSAELSDSRQAGERYLQPSVHLTRQLATQRHNSLPAPASSVRPARRKLTSR